MTVVVALMLMLVLSVAPAGWLWWFRRTRGHRAPGVAVMWSGVVVVACWIGVLGLYLATTEDSGEGHPRALVTTLVVVAAGAGLGVVGSTVRWGSQRSARRRDAELGLAVGRSWWPTWLVWVLCVGVAPLVAVVVGLMLGWALSVGSDDELTQEQVDGFVFPVLVVAGVVVVVGWVYVLFGRPALMGAETRRLRVANRDQLEGSADPGGDGGGQ